MNNRDIIGILNFHSSPELGPLTSKRALGATSFLGRYALCDFALSNFTNSSISQVGLLVKDKHRSIVSHMGNPNVYLSNTKTSRISFMFNETAAENPKQNTDIANLKTNDWVLFDSDAKYIVFQSSHIIANVDFREILHEHIKRNEEITVVYKHIDDASKEFTKEYLYEIDDEGYVKSASFNTRKHKEANVSMEIFIINRTVLADMVRMSQSDKTKSLKSLILDIVKDKFYRVFAYEFKGFARCIDSYSKYCEFAFELLNNAEFAGEFFSREWPHYTLTHDTPPALYGANADVKNCYVSNGSIIEGTLEDSIIARNVKIGQNSKVKNCIIFSDVQIGNNCHIENCLIDKSTIITRDKKILGEDKVLKYIKQDTII